MGSRTAAYSTSWPAPRRPAARTSRISTRCSRFSSARHRSGSVPRDHRLIERVVDPDAHDVVAQPHVGRKARSAEEGARAEVEVEILELRRPIEREFVLDAGADRAAQPRAPFRESDGADGRGTGSGSARRSGWDRAGAAGPELLAGYA